MKRLRERKREWRKIASLSLLLRAKQLGRFREVVLFTDL
jgi:hypothetical protein